MKVLYTLITIIIIISMIFVFKKEISTNSGVIKMKKTLVKTGFWFYTAWGKTYRFFERLFNFRRYKRVKKDVDNFFKELHESNLTPEGKWDTLMQYYNFKWRADKWYMLGDVISDPYLALDNNGDDCDGFATIALLLFGDTIEYNGKVYKGGYWSYLNKGWKNGHAIAVWKAEDGNCFVVSNGLMFQTNNEEEIMEWFKKYYKYELGIIVKYSKDFKVTDVIL
jgi:hypothetical protein